MPDLYFNRVPSLPATDDGSARPLTEPAEVWTSPDPAAGRATPTAGWATSAGTYGCGCSPRCSWPTCSPGPPTYWGPSPPSTSSAPSKDKTGNVALKPPFPGLPYLVTEAVGVEAVKPVFFYATRVVFRAIDAFGNQRRYRSGQVGLTLSGPAMLLGDNPFEFGQYGGPGAVWIRSLAGQPGAITLTASHPLLGQAEVHVRSATVTNTGELG